MEFKLVEDTTERWPIEVSDDESINSEEFFYNQNEVELSSAEEDKWEDSDAESGRRLEWEVPKLAPVLQSVRKPAHVSGSVLKYLFHPQLFLAAGLITKIVTEVGRVYLLDSTGRLSIYREADRGVKRLEIQMAGGRLCTFRDLLVIDGVMIALGRNAKLLGVINPDTHHFRQIGLFEHRDVAAFTALKRHGDNYLLLGGQSVLLMDASSHLVIRRINLPERVVDAAAENGLVYILTEARLVKYCSRLQERVFASETLVVPQSLLLVRDYLVIGAQGSLTIRNKYTLEIVKELTNLRSVTKLAYLEAADILAYGNAEQDNGLRLVHLKTFKVITNFQIRKGMKRVTAINAHNGDLLLATGKILARLEITK